MALLHKLSLSILLLIFASVSWAQSPELQALYEQFDRFAEAKDYEQGIYTLEERLVLEESEYGVDSPQYVNSLCTLGFFYSLNHQFENALHILKKCLATQERLLGPEHVDVAYTFLFLASSYFQLSLYKESESSYQRALVIMEKELGAEHRGTAITLNNLALLYQRQARYTEAEPLYQRALAIIEKVLGPEHPEVATSLNNLAFLYDDQGRYSEAEPLYQRALSIVEEVFGSEHPKVGSMLTNLAALYNDQARYIEAEVLYQRALVIYEKEFGFDHPVVAATLSNLGLLYSHQARYSEAESFYQRALAIDEKLLGPAHPDIAITLNNLALLYLDQARYLEAEVLYQRALTINEKALGPEHPDVGNVLSNLAILYDDQGRHNEAEPLYQRALTIIEKVLGPEHPDMATTLSNLATLYLAQARYTNAEPLYQRALAINEKVLGPQHPEIAITLSNLAALYAAQARYSEAEPLYQRALAIIEKVLGPEQPKLATMLSNLAFLYQDQGRLTNAIESIRRTTSIHRGRFTHKDVGETKGLLGEQKKVHRSFEFHIDLALHPSQEGNRSKLEAEAFEVMQLGRTSSAAGALSRMAARFASSDDEMARLIREQQDSLADYDKLDAQLINALGASTETRGSETINQLRESLKSLESKIEGLNQTIQEAFPEYGELTSREPLSLKPTQELLGRDEVLLAMTRSWKGDQTHVFVVRSDESTAYTVELGVSEIEQMVSQLRSGIDPATGRIKAFDVGLAHELYRRLLSPAESMLVGVDHLFVVPEGPLESLPFHLLVTEDPGEVSLPGLKGSGQRGFTVASDTTQVTTDTDLGYQDIAWLAKRYAITTLPSIASLRALRVFAKRAEATEPFIGFGDPVLGGQSGDSKGLQVASFFRGAVANVDEVRQLSSLPETETELRAMAQYLGANDDAIYLRERATESQVKSVILNQSKVVAFSTHGLVSGELKGLAEPALVLTPPETGTEHDDGLLTASEVAQLKLDADWVILSACNTAAGDKPGATGLSGLAKAFFYAGARALLVSHWPVESNAATALTTNMFQAIKQNPMIGRAEALRQSMMTLASNPKTAHPFFWAPFVVVGEGG